MSSVIESIFKAVIVSVVLACAGWYFVQQVNINVKVVQKITDQNEQIASLKLENVNLAAAVQELTKQFGVLTNLTDQQRKDLAAAELSARMTEANGELKTLKDIMLQTPEKAVRLERLQVRQEADFKVLEDRVAGIKDQFGMLQSLLYVMVGLVFALLGYIWKMSNSERARSVQRVG